MTADLEDRLIESMHHRVDGIALTGDVLGRATSRHRRRTAMIRAGYGLGVAGLAGVLAAGLAVGAGPGPRAGTEAPAVRAAPAAMRLANAADASGNLSYRLRLRTGTGPGESRGLTTEGAFDPRTDTGYLRTPQPDSVQVELLIDGTRYAGGEPPTGGSPTGGRGETFGRYGQYPGKHDSFRYWSTDAVLVKAGPDPGSLARALREVDATTSENPDGTLHFAYRTSTVDGLAEASGDVVLDRDGRIAKITLASAWRSTAKGKPASGTSTSTLELYDYGVEVRVQRPADVVPAS